MGEIKGGVQFVSNSVFLSFPLGVPLRTACSHQLSGITYPENEHNWGALTIDGSSLWFFSIACCSNIVIFIDVRRMNFEYEVMSDIL